MKIVNNVQKYDIILEILKEQLELTNRLLYKDKTVLDNYQEIDIKSLEIKMTITNLTIDYFNHIIDTFSKRQIRKNNLINMIISGIYYSRKRNKNILDTYLNSETITRNNQTKPTDCYDLIINNLSLSINDYTKPFSKIKKKDLKEKIQQARIETLKHFNISKIRNEEINQTKTDKYYRLYNQEDKIISLNEQITYFQNLKNDLEKDIINKYASEEEFQTDPKIKINSIGKIIN